MQFDTFLMERNQTLFENGVEINLTESGVHPCTIEEILPAQEAQALLRQPLGYGWTDGRPDLQVGDCRLVSGSLRRQRAGDERLLRGDDDRADGDDRSRRQGRSSPFRTSCRSMGWAARWAWISSGFRCSPTGAGRSIRRP